MKLKPSLLLLPAAAAVLFAGGCNLFRKTKKPKENTAIAADVEADFRQRWVERRVGELTAKGLAAEAARQQAENEFREKYAFLKEDKK